MLKHAFAPAILAAGSAALMLSGCDHKEADARTAPPLVRTATLQQATAAERGYSGIISARVQSDLGFRVPGKITERLVDTGQRVRKGQPLMRIDGADLSLATTASAGSVEAARARAIQTEADEKRLRDLVTAGAVSQAAYDQAKAAADAAAAQLRAALAQANITRNQAGYSTLVADADGVVVATLVEPGQVVTAGQTVVRLAHAGPREAAVSLPETLRPAVGSTAQASVFESGATGSATLRQLSDAADPATRTFEARYVLEGAAATAPLGATVSVHIPVPAQASATRVPLSAIYDAGRGPGVWTLSQDRQPKVHWTPVTLTGLGEEEASINGGLSPGQRFVALGAHLLHEGQVVRVDTGASR